MESHTDNKNEKTAGEGFQNQGGSPPVSEWSEEFECYTVNGILAPSPLSEVLMEELEDEPQSESSGPTPGKRQHGSPISTPEQKYEAESSKKKRTTEGNEEFFFRLFKFPKVAGEQYLLEMHQAKTCRIDRSQLFVYMESNGKWKIGACDLAAGEHLVVPVVEDPSPPRFPKTHQLPLQERLTGWTVERRKRGNGKEDKFYYHRGRQFRSFVEVTAFLLYSTKLKHLKTTIQNSPPHPHESDNYIIFNQ